MKGEVGGGNRRQKVWEREREGGRGREREEGGSGVQEVGKER